MAYLKVKYRKMMDKMDKESKLPKGWHYFVKKELEKDGLLIKTKGICKCTNCGNEFKTNKKINEYDKCPKCKNEYLIKKSTYKGHIFDQTLFVLLDKVDNEFVIRLFEAFSRYSNGEIFHSTAVEYGRFLVKDDIYLCNNRLFCYAWGNYKVYYDEKIKKWKVFADGRSTLNTNGKIYFKNIESILKNTEYEYSQLWILLQKEKKADIKFYLKHNYKSVEMLVKMGLYKLALCPQTFNRKGSFEERFGINKSYYPFMKAHNLDIDELNILKLYKKQDIENIKFLKHFNLEYLREITEYITLDKFLIYADYNKAFDIYMYRDYLSFLRELGMDLKNKKYLFPDNLTEEHNRLEKQIEMKKNREITKKINKRYKDLEKNMYSNKQYIIFPAKNVSALEDESKQQRNCVRTYAERYSKGECDIYFMRRKHEPKKSLVTVEVRKNKVVQSRTKFNNNIDKAQKRFLNLWEDQVLNNVA